MKKNRNNWGPKTSILNLVRRIFTIRIFEQWLVRVIENNPDSIFIRLAPSERVYKKHSIRAVNKNGINYKLDLSNIVDNYIYFGVPAKEYDSILDKIRSASVILDVGANIGSTALFFANLNPKAKIYAFEPHPKTYQRALENFSLNDFDNIELIKRGLGEKKDRLKLFEINSNNPGMNRILKSESNFPFFEIEIDTIDSFLSDKNGIIDFIKIDVEGYEFEVLKGAKSALLQSTPLLFLELDNNNLSQHGESAKSLIQFLYEMGYKKIYRSDDLREIYIEDNFENCHLDIIAHG